ncbi:molecular chaperone DnaK [Kordiimonas sediminis]|uniref:Molecular chaperone DnaK n=1 Tax=Kordiimonas sediminis TaxID=1735581 RepID=A0A919EA93_9PROT|nr:TraR/DksA C4-type zinc finger protein [Kordiimonas sediminis]GHF27928.1 molecular chaperone DnaK [Kordiimonas sediminis]
MKDFIIDKEYWSNKLDLFEQEVLSLDEASQDSRKPVELDQTSVGRLSRMDAMQGQAMNLAIAARRKQSLVKIQAARLRLEEEEFGYCITCGDDIAVKRLELDPTVSVCTNCSKQS